ncbi:MAG: hypothetical protein GY861_16400 [bacterium]|nr:hypothetical protein [bacterium]
MTDKKMLLVGDNPFHGISHLSQERAASRGEDVADPKHAAVLVQTALANGADGFMFSVSDTTLSILQRASKTDQREPIQIYAILPYAFEFVRLAVTQGGIPGLVKKMGSEIVFSWNFRAALYGVKGITRTDPESLLKSYLLYEESRIRSAAGKNGTVASILLHEVVTDMALALNMEWLVRAHIDFMQSRGIKPGFQTHNFAHLVTKFETWGIDFRKVCIAAQFNSLGFWMCPSRTKCEEALKRIPDTEVIAYGILASGYLKVPEATEYVKGLPGLSGIAVGVSKEHHAHETFKLMKENL